MSTLNPSAARIPREKSQFLRELAPMVANWDEGTWPLAQLRHCERAGVYHGLVPAWAGGNGWDQATVLQKFWEISRGCLTTAFVLTQHAAAINRLKSQREQPAAMDWLGRAARGEVHLTVGISHLSTSRQHVGTPVLRAQRRAGGWELEGYTPWVTAAEVADAFVVGATTDEGDLLWGLIPRQSPGVTIESPANLLALTGSRTGAVRFSSVPLPADLSWCSSSVLSRGPAPNVVADSACSQRAQGSSAAGTGGLATSAIALGLAAAAGDYLAEQAIKRAELLEIAKRIADEHDAELCRLLQLAAASESTGCTVSGAEQEAVRHSANELVLAATKGAMLAAKGAGFVASHPVARWSREALFFLVWSCPPGVWAAHLAPLPASR